MNNKLNIITYHYVRDKKKSSFPNLKAQSVHIFRKQLNFMKKNYNIITPEQFINFINGKEVIKKKSYLLTFDDGYIDHYKIVLPELKKRNIYGIFFPPVQAIMKRKIADVNKIQLILAKIRDKKKLLNEILLYLNKINYTIDFEYFKKKNFINFKKRFDDKNTKYIKFLLQVALPIKIREKTCSYFFNKYISKDEKKISNKLYMNFNHLKKLKSNGMMIGGHGYKHLRLNMLTKKEQENEISKTYKFLKYFNGSREGWTMCYPHGAYNKNTIQLLKKYKCSCGFTSNKGQANLIKRNLYELKRLDTNDIKIK